MNINEEKSYCYQMMKDITDERRRLSEMYMSLKTRVDELNRLEEKGITELSTQGFYDHYNAPEPPIELVTETIKKASEEITATITKVSEEIAEGINYASEQIELIPDAAEEIIEKLEQMTPSPEFEEKRTKAVIKHENKTKVEPEPKVNDYENGSFTGVKIGQDKIKRYQLYYTCDNPRCRHKGKRYIAPEVTQVFCHECANKMRVKPATSKGFPNADSFNNYFIAGARITEEEAKAYGNPAFRIEDVLNKYESERENLSNIRITPPKEKVEKKEKVQEVKAEVKADKDKKYKPKKVKPTPTPTPTPTPAAKKKPGPKPGSTRKRERVLTGLSTEEASKKVEEILKENGKAMQREALWEAVVMRTGATKLTMSNFVNNLMNRILKINPKVVRSAEKGFYQYKG